MVQTNAYPLNINIYMICLTSRRPMDAFVEHVVSLKYNLTPAAECHVHGKNKNIFLVLKIQQVDALK